MISDKARISLRSQDIQTGLQDFNIDEYAPGEFRTLPLTGMAARLALHIRGKELMDYRQLSVVAAKLGIRGTELDGVLEGLVDCGWVAVQRRGSAIQQLAENVPYFSDIYTKLGERASSQGFSELEQLSLTTLERASSGPVSVDRLLSEGVDPEALKVVTRLGEEGTYLSMTGSLQGAVIYSPLYWQEKPERLGELLKLFGEDTVRKAVESIKTLQGKPLDFLGATPEDDMVRQAITLGLLPTPSVNSVGGEKRFIFTPYMGNEKIEVLEKHVYEKALLLLSCLRYGQHFAQLTRIAYPQKILNALLDETRQHRIGPHSEIALQYSPLVVRGVGKVIRAIASGYFFQLIPTPENLKATRVALDLLTYGEPVQERGLLAEQDERALYVQADYKENLRSASDLRRKKQIRISQVEATRLAVEFAEIVSRGAV